MFESRLIHTLHHFNLQEVLELSDEIHNAESGGYTLTDEEEDLWKELTLKTEQKNPTIGKERRKLMVTPETKFKGGYEDFPILYEDYSLRVYKNSSGEIFVENTLDTSVSIRIGASGNYIQVTGSSCNLLPCSVRGLQGFRASPRGM